ncbi:hypothetical protein [Streptomyces sp. NPDC002994]|uniref:hypothetical protein n=1 Tax=Streptomyces sp. NPDC002994 TaxID=3154441 RepID=UPI0033A542C0
MAVIVVHDLPGATQAQYEQVTNTMTGGRGMVKTSSDWPVPGLISHVTGPTPTGWIVVDVWESAQAWQQFAEKLMPLTREAGLPEVEPKVYEAVNLVIA